MCARHVEADSLSDGASALFLIKRGLAGREAIILDKITDLAQTLFSYDSPLPHGYISNSGSSVIVDQVGTLL